MTPTTPLNSAETVVHSFLPDRGAYWRDHAWMAAGAMTLGMTILWAVGNPHEWTGAVGGLAAIAVRAFYLASDELNARWDMTETRLLGPQGRNLRLTDIKHIRTLGSAVQLITHSGDKHMLKFQANRDDTIARIERAQIGGWS
ncbi:hypothetical protein [Thalassovita gelatinovora]|nr:hypothetical protein [Thalassovita gelatinovora]